VKYKNAKRKETKDYKREPREVNKEMKGLKERKLNERVKDRRKRVRTSA
jgi:hypothetical protein